MGSRQELTEFMDIQDKIVLEATGEWPFEFCIEKAVALDEVENEEEELILEGIASTTNVDHDNERMSGDALKAMESAINDGGVPLRVEHSKGDNAIIGKVFKAWVDERNQLHIKARLDKTHAVSPILHASMKQGTKMGLSVGGIVKRAVKEFVESTGKMVKTFYEVALNEVSVTPRPANYDSYVMAKHITEKENDGDRFREGAFYNDFLKDHPQLDYLQVFAKSIPDKAWHKVASTNNNSMEKKTEETTEATEKKAVSRQEFDALKTSVTKGFEAVMGTLKKMTTEAKDQVNPDEDKDQEVEGATKSETESDKTKEKAESETETKEKADASTDEDEKEKAESETETKEKAEASEEDKYGKKEDTTDEYDLKTITRATKTITAIGDRVRKAENETETKEKAEDETETKTKTEKEPAEETTKGVHPLDVLAVSIAKTLEAMEEKMQKSGTTMIGFQKSVMDSLHNDPEFQEEVQKMMKVPGSRRSMSMGVPYSTTKDGTRYRLVPAESNKTTIEKSRDGKKEGFLSTYKSEYSSIHDEPSQ